ncbi:MAG TPA: hypothetical protein VJS92_18010, partial [Candidatus Polarisedimenticolaceae bacterium]|nr:hypothetical protein [Candidatus Polarisedimenticolaceae bacterium]
MRARDMLAAALLATLGTGALHAAAGAARLKLLPPAYDDGKGVGLSRPEGVACDGRHVAVADTGGGRIVLFDASGEALLPQGVLALPELPQPLRLAFRPGGGLLVLDGKSRRIGRVAAGGAFEGWLEIDAPGGVTPKSLQVGADGKVYVLDVKGRRVLVAGADGQLVRRIELPPATRFPADLALGPHGEVYVVDGIGATLLVANAEATAATPLARL